MLPRPIPGQQPLPLSTGLVDRVNFAVQFEKYRDILVKRWWILATCLSIALIYGGLRAFLQPDVFMATGRLMVRPLINTQVSPDLYLQESSNFHNTQVQLLQSRQVLDAVAARMAEYGRTLPIPPKPSWNVERIRESSIFQLFVSSTSAEYSKRFTDVWMTEFLSYKKQLLTQFSDSAVNDLIRQADRLAQDQRKAEEDLFEFKKKYNLPSLEAEGTAIDKDSLFRLQSERAELANYLRPKHPKLARLDEQIAHKIYQLNIALGQKEGGDPGLKQTPKGHVGADTNSVSSQRLMVRAGEILAEYDKLKSNVARAKELYDVLVKRQEQIQSNEHVQQEDFAISQEAIASLKPVGPDRTRLLLISILVGIGIAIGIILLLEKFDDRVKTVEELQDILHETVLGQIPCVVREAGIAAELRSTDFSSHNNFAESFRNVRSSLMFSPVASVAKTIAMTSALPGDGKTTCAVNLAICLSRVEGARTLLIDADLRRMNIHKYFKMENGPGLSEVLSGQATFEDCVVPSGHSNLDILRAGAAPPNPGELILTDNFKTLLQKTAGLYHRIVLDTAPVLATDDVLCLGPSVDGVILVVKANQTALRFVNKAVELLKARGTKFFGVILNNVDMTSAHYYYYYYYSNYYQSNGHKPSGVGKKEGPAIHRYSGKTTGSL